MKKTTQSGSIDLAAWTDWTKTTDELSEVIKQAVFKTASEALQVCLEDRHTALELDMVDPNRIVLNLFGFEAGFGEFEVTLRDLINTALEYNEDQGSRPRTDPYGEAELQYLSQLSGLLQELSAAVSRRLTGPRSPVAKYLSLEGLDHGPWAEALARVTASYDAQQRALAELNTMLSEREAKL